VKALASVIDDALPGPLFERLKRRVFALGSERLRVSYQTTFWFDFATSPSNVVEQAIQVVRTRVPVSQVVGAEWWLSRMRTSNVKVDFHQDRDNTLYAMTGRTRTPKVSSVLYLNASVGGLLALSRSPPNPKAPACAPNPRTFEVVAPMPNRFVFFRGHLTHGVLDAKNEIPLRRLPTQKRFRFGIAINFWHVRPLGIVTFTETSHYRRLAITQSRE
jgi:hypothetical protein